MTTTEPQWQNRTQACHPTYTYFPTYFVVFLFVLSYYSQHLAGRCTAGVYELVGINDLRINIHKDNLANVVT